MKILNDFGFEPTFFIAQIINFLILAFVFQKFSYKPILKILSDRRQAIAQSIKDIEDATRAKEEADLERNNIIKTATLEAENIIANARKSSEVLRESILEKTKSDAQKIIFDAKIASQLEFEKAQDMASDIALGISKKMLDKVLGELFTNDEKQKILERGVKKLSRYD